MEAREPMKRGTVSGKGAKAMGLPEGKTCADCVHCRRCCMIFGHIPADEVCGWLPSRFRPKREEENEAAEFAEAERQIQTGGF